MSKKSFIDSVKVGDPCSEKWEEMSGNDRIRFCSHCSKSVSNLSAITRKQASRLVRSSDGKICIRYIKNPVDQRPMFAEQLLQITRRSPSFTAGIMSASLALSTMAYGQSAPAPERASPVVTLQERNRESDESTDREIAADPTLGSIEGFVLDQSGRPVSDVEVMIVGAGEESDTENTTTDEKGRYRFEELEAGTYVIRIGSSSGLMKKVARAIPLAEGQNHFQNIYVRLAPVVEGEEGVGYGSGSGSGFGGAMASVQYLLPLNRAVADNDVTEVRKLLSEGEPVNGKDDNYNGISPLFVAVENGNVEIVKLLLNHGAKVNEKDGSKRTAIMFIDGDATPELIELLVSFGAKVNVRDEDGETLLLSTIDYINVEVLNTLIRYGADFKRADEEGITPLMKVAEENDLAMVKALVIAGADVNEKDKREETAWDKTSRAEIEEFLEVHGAYADYSAVEVKTSLRTVNADSEVDGVKEPEVDQPIEKPVDKM